jgi:hypothetical protein
MRFYSFADITAAGNCVEFAKSVYGAVLSGDHCNAAWRNGDNPKAVHITKEQFFDHVEGKGGGILQLAMFKCGDLQAAQEFLGDYYHLTPKAQTGAQPVSCRYEDLIRKGYREVKRYLYRDLAGNVVHHVSRLEHATEKKQFCQGTPDGWGVKGIKLIPYNLATITASDWVCIVEGEKSADILIERGIPATTFCGGAKKWDSSYAEVFRGKSIAVMPDNDAPGREHAEIIAAALSGVAADIKIVPTSPKPKGDVYNYLVDEGHTEDDVINLIANAPEYLSTANVMDSNTETGPTEAMLAAAKTANTIPFRNYIPSEVESAGRGGKPKKEIRKEPRNHLTMVADIHKRFLGFPYKLGKRMLFDHDRDTGEIIELDKPVQIKSWISRRSKQNAEFARGDNLVTECELYESLINDARRFESVSLVPDWPRRHEVYYAHDKMPDPSPAHEYLEAFADFFIPSTVYDRCLIKAFICCPLWFIQGVKRPAWVIDSKDAQGSGKSTLAEIVAKLYGFPALTVSQKDLEFDQKEIRKRCVSMSGRNARVFLVDNVEGSFKSPELSSLITMEYISGMAPYGHGEESRENNLVYTITTNGATLDMDLIDRSFFIYVNHPTPAQTENWTQRVLAFMKKYRLHVISDIIDMMQKHTPFPCRTATRFSEFEQGILQPCCGTMEMYLSVIEHSLKTRSDSNIEEEYARAIIDLFEGNLDRLGLKNRPVFLHSPLVNSWGGSALSDIRNKRDQTFPVQIVRNLAKKRLLPMVDASIIQWPKSTKFKRYKGIAFWFEKDGDNKDIPVVTLDHNGVATIVDNFAVQKDYFEGEE